MNRPPARGDDRRTASARRTVAVAAVLLALPALIAACGGEPHPAVTRQYSSPAAVRLHGDWRPPAGAALSGVLKAPGGPYLLDRWGRVVVLHGVNAVEKRPPYVLTVAPGKPWNFDAADARRIAALGFDVVRLGVVWAGLEPGHGRVDDPAVCAAGPPGNPHEFNRRVADAYLAKVARTVDLLGRQHVYTLLDMHEDLYAAAFTGEGAPTWAVCTGSKPIVLASGRWSRNYADASLGVAVRHFWSNDVVGNLQGQFDLVWRTVAHYFADNPWIVGYDPLNEPFSPEVSAVRSALPSVQSVELATELECFYTGRADPGVEAAGRPALGCPPHDPRVGLVPTIEAADPHHLVFVEPDIYGVPHATPSMLGPMPFPRLVFNFHDYCSARSPVTGDPTTLDACVGQELQSLSRLEQERPLLATHAQPGGPPAFMSEFGATRDRALVQQLTEAADPYALGWAYWSWKYYDDPTGSADEALVGLHGRLSPTAAALSATYAQAIAGTPMSVSSTPLSGQFDLLYAPTPGTGAPTLLDVPGSRLYAHGYCTLVQGGSIESPPGARHLVVANTAGATRVDVTVSAGRCP